MPRHFKQFRILIALALAFVLVASPDFAAAQFSRKFAYKVLGSSPTKKAVREAGELTRKELGELGERGMKEAIERTLKTRLDDLTEILGKRSINSPGVDGLFRDMKTGRLLAVESKATTRAESLGADLLGKTKYGQQISPQWVQRKFDVANIKASSIIADPKAKPQDRLMAHRLQTIVKDLDNAQFKNIDRTLVVTRLNGGKGVTEGLKKEVPHIIEVSGSGRVLCVTSVLAAASPKC